MNDSAPVALPAATAAGGRGRACGNCLWFFREGAETRCRYNPPTHLLLPLLAPPRLAGMNGQPPMLQGLIEQSQFTLVKPDWRCGRHEFLVAANG